MARYRMENFMRILLIGQNVITNSVVIANFWSRSTLKYFLNSLIDPMINPLSYHVFRDRRRRNKRRFNDFKYYLVNK